MINNLKVLFVNFSQKDEFQVRGKMEKMKISFKADSIEGDKSITKAHRSYDYDLIFLNIEDFEDDCDKVMSDIRSKFPLAEMIIIAKEKSYDMAISAIRVGVRDILQFPIDQTSLNVSIKTAYSYRHAYFLSEKYSKLLSILNHFGNLRQYSNEADLFKTVSKYLSHHFSASKSFVFSYDFQDKEVESLYGAEDSLSFSHENFKDLINDEEKFLVKESDILIPFYESEGKGLFLSFDISKDLEIYKFELLFTQLSSIIRNSYDYIQKRASEEKMNSLAHTDDVTGLYNQRKLYKDIDRNIEKAKENDESFSLVFLDLDNFKNVNDGHGHLVGSNLLQQVADVIRLVIRDTDYIYRYGGDEFVIILPTAKAENAKDIGERLLEQIKSHHFQAGEGETFKLSLSIGIAEYPRDATDREEILKIADQMMYEAKKTGRGRVCLIDEIFDKNRKLS